MCIYLTLDFFIALVSSFCKLVLCRVSRLWCICWCTVITDCLYETWLECGCINTVKYVWLCSLQYDWFHQCSLHVSLLFLHQCSLKILISIMLIDIPSDVVSISNTVIVYYSVHLFCWVSCFICFVTIIFVSLCFESCWYENKYFSKICNSVWDSG